MLQAVSAAAGGQTVSGGNRRTDGITGSDAVNDSARAATQASRGALLALRRVRPAMDPGLRPGVRSCAGTVATSNRERQRIAGESSKWGRLGADRYPFDTNKPLTHIRLFATLSNRRGRTSTSLPWPGAAISWAASACESGPTCRRRRCPDARWRFPTPWHA